MGVDEILKIQAIEEGEAKGRAEGKAKGRAEGRAEAEQAQHIKMREIVANMRKEGFSADKIANLMSLSLEQVQVFFNEIDALNMQ